ncbi:hypothetical protein AAH991_37475 [Microbispora sp. ZYX-F-249]|uniref:Uncharacterized protein n=1 Tax=Microbispora maris TaxID=3144104 RepID=A0ABV0B027_9ACTN
MDRLVEVPDRLVRVRRRSGAVEPGTQRARQVGQAHGTVGVIGGSGAQDAPPQPNRGRQHALIIRVAYPHEEFCRGGHRLFGQDGQQRFGQELTAVHESGSEHLDAVHEARGEQVDPGLQSRTIPSFGQGQPAVPVQPAEQMHHRQIGRVAAEGRDELLGLGDSGLLQRRRQVPFGADPFQPRL